MDNITLIEQALKIRDRAYAPYSRFSVGAVVVTDNDKIYDGCNVESVSFTPTCCAERTAIVKAVSDGEQKINKIVVVGGAKDKPITEYCYPCGVCRQFILEFASENCQIIVAKNSLDYVTHSIKEIIPFGFTKLV